MSNLNLVLSVERDKKVLDQKKLKLLDKKTHCDFCGIELFEDRNYHLKNDNYYLSCKMCYYVENLEKVISMDKGSIILMPEISQIELNNIVRIIWFLQSIEDEKYIDKIDNAINLLEQIKERENFVESYYTEGANDVNIIINFLYNVKKEKYDKREIGFHGLLWLPPKSIFENEIISWNKSLIKYHPANFEKIILELKKILDSKG